MVGPPPTWSLGSKVWRRPIRNGRLPPTRNGTVRPCRPRPTRFGPGDNCRQGNDIPSGGLGVPIPGRTPCFPGTGQSPRSLLTWCYQTDRPGRMPRVQPSKCPRGFSVVDPPRLDFRATHGPGAASPYSNRLKRSVPSTRRSTMPTSMAACPASGTISSAASGQRRWRSQAFDTGQHMS